MDASTRRRHSLGVTRGTLITRLAWIFSSAIVALTVAAAVITCLATDNVGTAVGLFPQATSTNLAPLHRIASRRYKQGLPTSSCSAYRHRWLLHRGLMADFVSKGRPMRRTPSASSLVLRERYAERSLCLGRERGCWRHRPRTGHLRLGRPTLPMSAKLPKHPVAPEPLPPRALN
jgi:hypothetical protein